MKKLWVLIGCVWAPWAWADGWFTIMGDVTQIRSDVVQVQPTSIQRQGELRTLNIRVNRLKTRRNWHGVTYRSYEAKVLINCNQRHGEYLSLRTYSQALWMGETQELKYDAPLPPMRFIGIEPNPTDRIVRAACVFPRRTINPN